MKISDFICQYPTGSFRGVEGLCRVRIFVPPRRNVVAVLTELDGNPSQSVTNAVEVIRASLIQRGFIDAQALIIEHYERDFSRGTFDLVTFEGETRWKSLKLAQIEELIGCDTVEFTGATVENPRLLQQIEQYRNAMDPFMDFPRAETPEIVVRRLDIQSKMVSKEALSSLVANGAGERDLQRVIKSDPSILGEIYGHPHDEYICFSEFAVAQGFVDFAVFTGRSRMDVVLIEVKGADFFLVNGDSYAGFSRNINQAADQVRERLGHAYRDLWEFRSEVHRIRSVVESGKTVHNSLQGPKGNLQVDPRKDINLWGVAIGGRTRDDLQESAKRHTYETLCAPHIRIESWDTWLRKLRRL